MPFLQIKTWSTDKLNIVLKVTQLRTEIFNLDCPVSSRVYTLNHHIILQRYNSLSFDKLPFLLITTIFLGDISKIYIIFKLLYYREWFFHASQEIKTQDSLGPILVWPQKYKVELLMSRKFSHAENIFC